MRMDWKGCRNKKRDVYIRPTDGPWGFGGWEEMEFFFISR